MLYTKTRIIIVKTEINVIIGQKYVFTPQRAGIN